MMGLKMAKCIIELYCNFGVFEKDFWSSNSYGEIITKTKQKLESLPDNLTSNVIEEIKNDPDIQSYNNLVIEYKKLFQMKVAIFRSFG